MESYCVRDFFALYGTAESSCMCLGIAIGLPGDAGGSRHIDPSIIGEGAHGMGWDVMLCDDDSLM